MSRDPELVRKLYGWITSIDPAIQSEINSTLFIGQKRRNIRTDE